jgi:HlyD family secretion protein
VTVKTIDVTLSANGSLLPIRQARLTFQTSAPVKEILVSEGETVQKGDTIAVLDTRDLQAALRDAQIARDQQQARLDQALAPPRDVDLAVAKARLNAAKSALAAAAQGTKPEDLQIAKLQIELAGNVLWQKQLQRDETLSLRPEFRNKPGQSANAQDIQLNAAAQQAEYDLQIAQEKYDKIQKKTPDAGPVSSNSDAVLQAQIQLDRLIQGPTPLERQQLKTDLARADLAVQSAQDALNRATLIAPFDGLIVRNTLSSGAIPTAADLVLINDTSSYYTDLSIDETDIPAIKVGQPVALQVDALPKAIITGTVTRVDTTATPIGQLVTYTARVTVDPTPALLRSQMSITATITTNTARDVLTIPNRFVRINETTQRASVLVAHLDGQIAEVPITLGLRNDTDTQVTSGLKAGDRVVLASGNS